MSVKRIHLLNILRGEPLVHSENGAYVLYAEHAAALTAEVQRRVAAEAVVDALSLPNTTPALTKQMAHDYRLLYPKESAT